MSHYPDRFDRTRSRHDLLHRARRIKNACSSPVKSFCPAQLIRRNRSFQEGRLLNQNAEKTTGEGMRGNVMTQKKFFTVMVLCVSGCIVYAQTRTAPGNS